MTSDDYESVKCSLLQELGTLQERLCSLRERLDVKSQSIRENYRRELDLMTSDKALAYGYLRDKDPSLRLLALEALASHWTPDEAYYEQCELLAVEDAEVVVRARALKILRCALYGNIKRQADDARCPRSEGQPEYRIGRIWRVQSVLSHRGDKDEKTPAFE